MKLALLSGLSVLMLAGPVHADDPATDESLRDMADRANLLRLTITSTGQDVKMVAEPIFRFNDPARLTTDGTLWIWDHESQPLAILSLFREPKETLSWSYELVQLADTPIRVTGRPEWSWQPLRRNGGWVTVDGPPPAGAESRRLTQFKQLARRFSASEVLNGEDYRLRLLPNPVYRYARPADGVVDGAIVLFAYGTNPEVALQIEALSGDASWRANFGRLSSAALTVTRDGETVWTAEERLQFNPSQDYFAHYGPDVLPAQSE